MRAIRAIQDEAILLLRTEEILFSAVAASMVMGLAMGCFRPLRTRAGMAIVGAASLAVIYRERFAGVCLVSLAAFFYVGLVDQSAGSRRRARWGLTLLGIVALIAGFLLESTSRARRDEVPSTGLGVVLDMLLLLRLILFLWEYGVERIGRPSLLDYVAWCALPFPVCGGILRPSEFLAQRPWEDDPLPRVGRGWWADVAVRVGMLLASAALAALSIELAASGRLGKAAIGFGTGPWAWYLKMAAASGLGRRAAALGGLDVPWNFDSPFKSSNIAEFWSRWNITATSAFRDMLFFNRWGFSRFNLYVNTTIVFLVVGLWHAVDEYWLIWGALHAAGFCTFIFWRKHRRPDARPLPAAVGWAITYMFVCSCWVLPSKVILLHRSLATYLSMAGYSP